MYNGIFLTRSEVSDLTGAKQTEKQREWLSERGYLFDVRMDGSTVILRAHIENKLGGEVHLSSGRRKTSPNFNAV